MAREEPIPYQRRCAFYQSAYTIADQTLTRQNTLYDAVRHERLFMARIGIVLVAAHLAGFTFLLDRSFDIDQIALTTLLIASLANTVGIAILAFPGRDALDVGPDPSSMYSYAGRDDKKDEGRLFGSLLRSLSEQSSRNLERLVRAQRSRGTGYLLLMVAVIADLSALSFITGGTIL